jgi:hypothetical protein
MFQTKVVDKIKTHIVCSVIFFFFRNSCRLLGNVEIYGTTRQVSCGNTCNTAHADCVLDNWGYRHIPRICNTAFPPQQWLRERLWTLHLCVHCPPCSFLLLLMFCAFDYMLLILCLLCSLVPMSLNWKCWKWAVSMRMNLFPNVAEWRRDSFRSTFRKVYDFLCPLSCLATLLRLVGMLFKRVTSQTTGRGLIPWTVRYAVKTLGKVPTTQF